MMQNPRWNRHTAVPRDKLPYQRYNAGRCSGLAAILAQLMQHASDHREQLCATEGLRQYVFCAKMSRHLQHVKHTMVAATAHGYDPYLRKAFLQFADELEPVLAGHENVAQHEISILFSIRAQQLVAIASDGDLVPFVSKDIESCFAQAIVVVSH
jgi:hypothetical protein